MNFLSKLTKRIGIHNLALFSVLFVLVVVMSIISPYFLTPQNIEVIMMGFVLEGIMAIGMTLVILSGGIDLSVSSVLPFAAIITAFMLKAGWPPYVAIIITLAASTLIGFFNAFMNRLLRSISNTTSPNARYVLLPLG